VDEFLERLKQRKLVKWTLAYIAAAFALIQVLDVVAQRRLAEGTAHGHRVVLCIGFFVAVVVAWYHGDAAQRVSASSCLISSLLLAIGGVAVSRFALPSSRLRPAKPARRRCRRRSQTNRSRCWLSRT
jgi:hypothetical protein